MDRSHYITSTIFLIAIISVAALTIFDINIFRFTLYNQRFNEASYIEDTDLFCENVEKSFDSISLSRERIYHDGWVPYSIWNDSGDTNIYVDNTGLFSTSRRTYLKIEKDNSQSIDELLNVDTSYDPMMYFLEY